MISNKVEEYQQSFIPEGWVNIDRSQNRLSVFLRNYPFEEKFEGIREKFERYRYEERKKAGVMRKIQGDQEESMELSEGQGYLDALESYFGIQLDAPYKALKPVV